MEQNRKRLIWLAVGLVGLIILIWLLSLAGRGKGLAIKSNYHIPDIFQSATPYDNDTVLLANGRAFVRYNYRNGHSTQLSKDTTRPDTTNLENIELSKDKRYISFYNPEVSVGSTIESILAQEGTDTGTPYWWIYDTQDKTYRHLDSSTISVHVVDGKAYTLTRDGGNQKINIYSLPDLTQTASINIPATDDFIPWNGGFLLQNEHTNQLFFTKDGVVNQELFNNVILVGLLDDGTHAVAFNAKKNSTELMLLDLKGKNQKSIAVNVQNDVAIRGDHVFYSRTNNPGADNPKYDPCIYENTTGKAQRLTFESKFLDTASFTPEALLSGDTVIATDESRGTYLLSATSLKSFPNTSPTYHKVLTVEGQTVEITYYPDATQFATSINPNYAQAEAQAVYNQLAKDGYNPAATDIQFSLHVSPQLAPAPPAEAYPDIEDTLGGPTQD